jgi:hypothetical protein
LNKATGFKTGDQPLSITYRSGDRQCQLFYGHNGDAFVVRFVGESLEQLVA